MSYTSNHSLTQFTYELIIEKLLDISNNKNGYLINSSQVHMLCSQIVFLRAASAFGGLVCPALDANIITPVRPFAIYNHL